MSKKNDTEKSILPRFEAMKINADLKKKPTFDFLTSFRGCVIDPVSLPHTAAEVRNKDIMDALSYAAESVTKHDPILEAHNKIMADKKHDALTDMLDGQLTDKMNAAIQIAVHTYLGDKLKEIDTFMENQRSENINTAKRITETRQRQEKIYNDMIRKIQNALSSAYASKEKIKVIEKAVQDCVSNDRAFTSDMSDLINRTNEYFDRMHERHEVLDSKIDKHKESSDKHLVALQTQLSNVKREIANIQDKDDPVQWI